MGAAIVSGHIPLFTPVALAVLDLMPFDPHAKGWYESLSGGLIWPDEFPRPPSPGFRLITVTTTCRYLVAYRASVTLGEERGEFRPVWEQVEEHAPHWPGLHESRRGDQARRRLRAALRREVRCLEDLERHLDETGSD